MHHTSRLLVLLSLVSIASPSVAQTGEPAQLHTPAWYAQGGMYIHYSDDEDYEGPPLFASIEYHQTPKLLWGLSMFQNSFGQFSQYAYVGRMFHPLQKHPNFHIKLTGGVVHGYGGKHHDTLPIRWGDSWGIGGIPTIGYLTEKYGFDVAFLKASGILFLAGYRFE